MTQNNSSRLEHETAAYFESLTPEELAVERELEKALAAITIDPDSDVSEN